MINLEPSEKTENVRSSMHQMAESIFRPIARKYDEQEHTYPQELDMFRNLPVMGGTGKKKKESKDKKKKSGPGQNFPLW